MPSTPRATMADLIDRVRDLIADPIPNPPAASVFTLHQIQDALDRTRRKYAQIALDYEPLYVTGSLSYLDYFAPYGDWEGGVVLRDSGYATISSGDYTEYLLDGRWVFDASRTPPVYLSGTTYDVYRAAADLLDQWAAKEPVTQLQLPTGGVQLDTTAARGRRQQAQAYRRQARPRHARLIRADC